MVRAGTSALGIAVALCALIASLFMAANGVRAESHHHHAHHHGMAHTGHAAHEGHAGPAGAPVRQSHRADRHSALADKYFMSAQAFDAQQAMGWHERGRTPGPVPVGSGCPVTADPEHCEACPDAAILSLAWQRRDATVSQADRTVTITFDLLRTIAPATCLADDARPPPGVATSRKHRRSALFARLRL